jgi:hypothetical protein
MSRRNIIVNVTEFSSASHVDWEHDLRFRTIVMVDSTPVFLLLDITRAMSTISPDTHVDVSLTVAEYPPDLSTQASPLPQIALDQLRAVHHLLHGWDLADPVLLFATANASTMASGHVHTRRTCIKGPHRASWIDAEFAQMDKHHSYGMYGPPIPRSAVPPSARVVRPIWQYSQKGNSTFKARKCMNGKQLTRMGLTFEHTYAACMDQHCIRMFVDLAAILGFLIEDGDVVNAYAHADAEGPIIFLVTDEVFQLWYKDRIAIDLPLGTCVPILKAMQGHPEAGNWWSKHFEASCAAPLRFIPAFTEPTMYRHDDALCSGPTLVLRQVDDILCGTADATDRDAVMDGIASKVSFVRYKALTTLFYATNLEQCAQYIQIYASSYIGSCLTKLGWEATDSDSPLMAPLAPAVLKTLQVSAGPLYPSFQLSLETQFGFPYRTLTGMLIFSTQIGRFDIAVLFRSYANLTSAPRMFTFKPPRTLCATSEPHTPEVRFTGAPPVASAPAFPAAILYPPVPNVQLLPVSRQTYPSSNRCATLMLPTEVFSP